ncbi:MAG: hypothetical protein JWO12_278 [Frankiales bacterium]|nr:hypothetical protein [Frankiales bacterium]
MALIGVSLAGLLAAVIGSVLLARLLRDSERPMAASLLGAVFLVANVVSGRTTFALGAVAGLAALVVLRARPWAALLAVLTALLSPVAAAFLGFVGALLVLQRRPGGWTLGFASAIPVVVVAVLFPGGGVQPFDAQSAVPAVLIGLALAYLTSDQLVRTGALLWTAAVLVLVNSDDPFGSNVLRLGILLGATLLLATSKARGVLLAVAVVGSLVWQLDPTHADLQALSGSSTDAVTAELVARGSMRAEVVAPLNHRESWKVAERVPLARGWSRQIDVELNPLFYDKELSAEGYVAWLHEHGVDTVAVPRHGLIDFGSTTEAALLKHPVPGLDEVWRDPDWTVFAVSHPTPIAGAPAVVVASTRTELQLLTSRATTVDVKVTWSRWLSLSGAGCVQRRGDHVRIRFTRPGGVTLSSSLTPSGHC